MVQLQNGTVSSLQKKLEQLSITEALQQLVQAFPGKVTFSTSFSYEDQIITDLIQKHAPEVSIFTLDTGRLFQETYSVWSRTNDRYGIHVKPFYPDTEAIQNFVATNGPNPMYESLDLRKSCCFLRKVEPLQRALAPHSVWITGLRAEHSAARQSLETIEWDEGNQIIKYNPLLHWDFEKVLKYINEHNVPYNSLHDKGFVSIGCAPCTRAIKPGEDFRAGRWWWEDSSRKECGLHEHRSENPVITENVVD
jgi:phosphoadenosine phosphosulfate reductase